LGELERIEEAASRRLAKDPHGEGVSDAAVVMMLFEAVKLSKAEPNTGAKGTNSRRRRTRPVSRL
jgi:hypothetical protein